jgi:NAD(P)-dependent dehydrogenase (short-subunit alcohol dehydrogenase family)
VTSTPSAQELFSLDGTVALVTGGASGIGLAAAEVLASAGARTIIASLPGDRPAEVAAASPYADRLSGVDCDVTDADQLAALITGVRDEFGRLDTVFCNAGVALDRGPHLVSTDTQLDAMIDLHVRSVLHTANLALPLMAENGGGSFIIMSSLAGLRGNRTIGLYGITKAANAQLARNLAVQWGDRNIRVNAISPGVIATEFARGITDDPALAQARLAKTPLGRFGEPSHIAGTVLWLASPAGSFTSGQNIVVDGGTLVSD